jgi:hypothetical protein
MQRTGDFYKFFSSGDIKVGFESNESTKNKSNYRDDSAVFFKKIYEVYKEYHFLINPIISLIAGFFLTLRLSKDVPYCDYYSKERRRERGEID